jgi:hypothetical protein
MPSRNVLRAQNQTPSHPLPPDVHGKRAISRCATRWPIDQVAGGDFAKVEVDGDYVELPPFWHRMTVA